MTLTLHDLNTLEPVRPQAHLAAASAASVRSRLHPSADTVATSGGTWAVRNSTRGAAPTCVQQANSSQVIVVTELLSHRPVGPVQQAKWSHF